MPFTEGFTINGVWKSEEYTATIKLDGEDLTVIHNGLEEHVKLYMDDVWKDQGFIQPVPIVNCPIGTLIIWNDNELLLLAQRHAIRFFRS